MSDAKKTNKKTNSPLVVGLGASAGGLQALKAFFKSLPARPGMAFIVITHLSPEYESNLAELLQGETSLKVQQVNEKIAIEENYVYVIPPSKLLEVGDNHIEISDPKGRHALAAIDYLFRTLGTVKKRKAAGIILSGAGSDGTVGIKTIKENGGLTLVQEPEEAQYNDVPWSAIDSGVADFVLSVNEMGEKLLDYKKGLSEIKLPEVKDGEKKTLQKIFIRVRSQTGHDFSNYKRSSVLRRIERRMQVNQVRDLSEYLSYLHDHPDEIDNLFKDLLISVTNFFRDEKAFERLKEQVIPKLFDDKELEEQIRVWVPGCATGEEAYSIAILLQEHALQVDMRPEIQIFASDIDEAALRIARQGSYPDSIAADVSHNRLDRFFKHAGTQYQIRENIKSTILFAPHNLLSDPPFSKLDLIACRNLLIYLNQGLQTEVFNLFHYALRPQGYLFLGLSDSNLQATELFKPLDKKHRIYRRTPTSQSHLRIPQTHLQSAGNKPQIPYYDQRFANDKTNYEALHQRLLARLYAPESVIVNDSYKVIHATENISKFLEYAGGEPSHNILQMVKPQMRQALQSLFYSVDKNPDQHLHQKARLHTEDGFQQVELIVHRINDNNFSEGLIHVVFREISPAVADQPEADKRDQNGNQDESKEIIDTLHQELEDIEEQLHITIEEYETSNEELRASNEELQSTAEKLVTSKEELQSVNEELKTVNRKLERKVEEISKANDDLKNLMEATEIGILFVDRELCVQRFTSHATDIFNLIDSDKGRPLEHVTHQLDENEIIDNVKQVMNDLKHIKKVISVKDGSRWYVMRLRPYRTTEGSVKGVVLTFVDISQLKQAQAKLEEKARQEEALAQLGLYALEGKEPDEVIHRGVQIICEILKLDFCMVHKFNYEEECFDLIDASGNGFGEDCPQDISTSNEPKWDVAFTFGEKEFVLVEDYNEEKRFGLLPLLEDFSITSGANIIVKGTDDAYGVLSAYSTAPRSFSDHDISFLKVVANIVGEAIEHKRASDALEERNRQLKKEMTRSERFQREMLNNSIVERWELGSYLHDNLAQLLVSAKITINDMGNKLSGSQPEIVEEITQLKNLCDDVTSGIRDLAHDIIPVDIEQEGVEYAFRFLMHQTQKMYNVNCILKANADLGEIKNRKLATSLYHIVQEAVKNAAIHGQADNVNILITKQNGDLVVRIVDDGVGLSQSSGKEKGRGLRIMEYRMKLLGGTFTVGERSDDGQSGTEVKCTIPLKYLSENEGE